MKKTFILNLATENLDFLKKLAKVNMRSVSAQLSIMLNDWLEKERKKVKDDNVQKEQNNAHIKTSILKEHEFLGGSLVTVDDTISELGEDSKEDEYGKVL